MYNGWTPPTPADERRAAEKYEAGQAFVMDCGHEYRHWDLVAERCEACDTIEAEGGRADLGETLSMADKIDRAMAVQS